MFEDGSDAPFVVHMLLEQSDRLLPEAEEGGDIVVTVWTRGGSQLQYPCKYRAWAHCPTSRRGRPIKDSSRAAVPWPVTFNAVIHLLQ